MNKTTEQFYVMEYLPDNAGNPFFMDKTWDPELPDYDIFMSPPNACDFSSLYRLRASTIQLDGDYLINDNLVSSDFIKVCEECFANNIHIPVDISLLKNKKPEREYYLFFLLDYIEALDQSNSRYSVSRDIDSGLLNTKEERGLDKTYYDEIERFIVKKEIKTNLFFCQELSKPVCSKFFKERFEIYNLKGIEFKAIDESFKYNAWAGW